MKGERNWGHGYRQLWRDRQRGGRPAASTSSAPPSHSPAGSHPDSVAPGAGPRHCCCSCTAWGPHAQVPVSPTWACVSTPGPWACLCGGGGVTELPRQWERPLAPHLALQGRPEPHSGPLGVWPSPYPGLVSHTPRRAHCTPQLLRPCGAPPAPLPPPARTWPPLPGKALPGLGLTPPGSLSGSWEQGQPLLTPPSALPASWGSHVCFPTRAPSVCLLLVPFFYSTNPHDSGSVRPEPGTREGLNYPGTASCVHWSPYVTRPGSGRAGRVKVERREEDWPGPGRGRPQWHASGLNSEGQLLHQWGRMEQGAGAQDPGTGVWRACKEQVPQRPGRVRQGKGRPRGPPLREPSNLRGTPYCSGPGGQVALALEL